MLVVLSGMRWVIRILAIAIAALGVIALVQGNALGWLPIGIALLSVGMQHYLNREAARSNVDPRDTIG